MSSFTTPAILELLAQYKWRVVQPFMYYTDIDSTRRFEIDVPVDYVTDLTSVPRLLWSIFPPNGEYAKAAIVHDYLYSNAIGTKAWADNVFREAMGVLGVTHWRRILMYWAVRLFGHGAYKQ